MEPQNESVHEFARTLENISTSEYEQALERINRFNEQNRETISTLDELAKATAGLGDALMKVAHAKGEKDEKTISYTYPKSVFERRKKLEEELEEGFEEDQRNEEANEDDNNTFSITTNGNQFVTLSSMPLEGPQNQESYGVTISVLPINAQTDDLRFLNTVGGQRYMQSNGDELIFPRRFPNDPAVMKNYYDLLKKGVADFLATPPEPPTDIPSAFLQ